MTYNLTIHHYPLEVKYFLYLPPKQIPLYICTVLYRSSGWWPLPVPASICKWESFSSSSDGEGWKPF